MTSLFLHRNQCTLPQQDKIAYASHVTRLLQWQSCGFCRKLELFILSQNVSLFCVSAQTAARKRKSVCEKHITEVSSRFSAPGLIVVQHAKSLDGKFPT